MTKKKSIQIVFSVMLTFVLFLSCFADYTAFAKETTVLKVYNWGEYISNGDDDSLNVISEFEKRNPGVRVQYLTYPTNEEMYAKIVSGSADFDICIPSDYMIAKMIKEDMLAELNFNNIPNYSKIDPEFKDLEFDPDNKYSVPYTWGTVGIIYNKTMVDETIDSWDSLWDPKYTNQIFMFNNPRDSYGIALKKLGYSQNTTDKAQLEEATQLLKEQKSVVQAYIMDDIFAKMGNNEAALAPYYAGDAITMIDENPDLDFVVPKEGSNKFVDSMVVLKTSKNKQLAEQFINFMLEDEIAKANIEYLGYSTPMSSVRQLLDDDLKNSHIAYPDKEILRKCDTFIDLDPETNNYLQEKWTEVLSYGEKDIGSLILLCCIGLFMLGVLIYLYIKKIQDKKHI